MVIQQISMDDRFDVNEITTMTNILKYLLCVYILLTGASPVDQQ